jgi:hypothetical protein
MRDALRAGCEARVDRAIVIGVSRRIVRFAQLAADGLRRGPAVGPVTVADRQGGRGERRGLEFGADRRVPTGHSYP